MDPDACWRDLVEAIQESDYKTAGERAEDLLGWMKRGGFPPKINLENEIQHRIAFARILTSLVAECNLRFDIG
jgi:hypothetical protein